MTQQQPKGEKRRLAARVAGWLVRAVIVLGALGFVGHEVGAVVVANADVDGIATEAAEKAGIEYSKTHSSAKARRAAERVAERAGARVAGFGITRLTRSVAVTVHKEAGTWLIRRVGFIERFGVAKATRRARAV